MLLNDAGQKITEDAVKKVVTAAGVKADESKTKALVAALDGVDIKEVVEKAAVAPAVGTAPVAATEEKAEAKKEKKDEKKEEEKQEEAAAGLSALFG